MPADPAYFSHLESAPYNPARHIDAAQIRAVARTEFDN